MDKSFPTDNILTSCLFQHHDSDSTIPTTVKNNYSAKKKHPHMKVVTFNADKPAVSSVAATTVSVGSAAAAPSPPSTPLQAMANFFSLDNMEQLLSCVPLSVDVRDSSSHGVGFVGGANSTTTTLGGLFSGTHADTRRDDSNNRSSAETLQVSKRETDEFSFMAEREAVMNGVVTLNTSEGDSSNNTFSVDGRPLQLVQQTNTSEGDKSGMSLQLSQQTGSSSNGAACVASFSLNQHVADEDKAVKTPKASNHHRQHQHPSCNTDRHQLPSMSVDNFATKTDFPATTAADDGNLDAIPGGLWSLSNNDGASDENEETMRISFSVSIDSTVLGVSVTKEEEVHEIDSLERKLQLQKSIVGASSSTEGVTAGMYSKVDGAQLRQKEQEEANQASMIRGPTAETAALLSLRCKMDLGFEESSVVMEDETEDGEEDTTEYSSVDPILAAQRAVNHVMSPHSISSKGSYNDSCWLDNDDFCSHQEEADKAVEAGVGDIEDCHYQTEERAEGEEEGQVQVECGEDDGRKEEISEREEAEEWDDSGPTTTDQGNNVKSTEHQPMQVLYGQERIVEEDNSFNAKMSEEDEDIGGCEDQDDDGDDNTDSSSYHPNSEQAPILVPVATRQQEDATVSNKQHDLGLSPQQHSLTTGPQYSSHHHPYVTDKEANEHFDELMSSFELRENRDDSPHPFFTDHRDDDSSNGRGKTPTGGGGRSRGGSGGPYSNVRSWKKQRQLARRHHRRVERHLQQKCNSSSKQRPTLPLSPKKHGTTTIPCQEIFSLQKNHTSRQIIDHGEGKEVKEEGEYEESRGNSIFCSHQPDSSFLEGTMGQKLIYTPPSSPKGSSRPESHETKVTTDDNNDNETSSPISHSSVLICAQWHLSQAMDTSSSVDTARLHSNTTHTGTIDNNDGDAPGDRLCLSASTAAPDTSTNYHDQGKVVDLCNSPINYAAQLEALNARDLIEEVDKRMDASNKAVQTIFQAEEVGDRPTKDTSSSDAASHHVLVSSATSSASHLLNDIGTTPDDIDKAGNNSTSFDSSVNWDALAYSDSFSMSEQHVPLLEHASRKQEEEVVSGRILSSSPDMVSTAQTMSPALPSNESDGSAQPSFSLVSVKEKIVYGREISAGVFGDGLPILAPSMARRCVINDVTTSESRRSPVAGGVGGSDKKAEFTELSPHIPYTSVVESDVNPRKIMQRQPTGLHISQINPEQDFQHQYAIASRENQGNFTPLDDAVHDRENQDDSTPLDCCREGNDQEDKQQSEQEQYFLNLDELSASTCKRTEPPSQNNNTSPEEQQHVATDAENNTAGEREEADVLSTTTPAVPVAWERIEQAKWHHDKEVQKIRSNEDFGCISPKPKLSLGYENTRVLPLHHSQNHNQKDKPSTDEGHEMPSDEECTAPPTNTATSNSRVSVGKQKLIERESRVESCMDATREHHRKNMDTLRHAMTDNEQNSVDEDNHTGNQSVLYPLDTTTATPPLNDEQCIAERVGQWKLNSRRFEKAKEYCTNWENPDPTSSPKNRRLSSPIGRNRKGSHFKFDGTRFSATAGIEKNLGVALSLPRDQSLGRGNLQALLRKNEELEEEMRQIQLLGPVHKRKASTSTAGHTGKASPGSFTLSLLGGGRKAELVNVDHIHYPCTPSSARYTTPTHTRASYFSVGEISPEAATSATACQDGTAPISPQTENTRRMSGLIADVRHFLEENDRVQERLAEDIMALRV